MGEELSLLSQFLSDILIGKKISSLKVKERIEGFEISLSLSGNHILESGWKSDSRFSGSFLCWYVSLDGQEIFNEVDRKICSLE